jgi:hypothetical protein
LNVGNVRQTLSAKLAELGLAGEATVVHDPIDADERYSLADDTHALIMGIPVGDCPAAMAARARLAEIVLEALPAPPD